MAKHTLVRKITVTGMMSALAFVIMVFEFPIAALFPDFLKFDFSDLPAIITAFALGPVYGVAVELVKNLLHFAFGMSSTQGVGQIANFLVGSAFVLPAGFIYQYNKTRSRALIAMVAGVVSMMVVGFFANYYILLPFFINVMHYPLDAIIGMCAKIIPFVDSKFEVVLFSITSFNLFKGVILTLLTMVVYKHISRLIRKLV